jgi:hypothetical protein
VQYVAKPVILKLESEMTQPIRRTALRAMLAAPFVALFASSQAQAKGTRRMSKLEELIAKDEITTILNLYARGWDRLDDEALRSCFWPDSDHHHGGFKGKSHAFIDRAFPMVQKVKGTQHAISNIMIEIDGDRAFSECTFNAYHRRMTRDGTQEEDYFSRGRYIDRLERRGGVWKIAMRRGLNDYERVQAHGEVMYANAPPGSTGQRKPDDDFYRLQAEFRAGK